MKTAANNQPPAGRSETEGETRRRDVWRLFDAIAPRYDFLNHLLSLDRDIAWRRRLARELARQPVERLCDAATGTADILLAAEAACSTLRLGVGCDLAAGMLHHACRKIADRRLETKLAVVRGNASQTMFCDGTFDAVTIAFGIRNVADVPATLREFNRILKPGGRVLVLEFSLPSNRWFRAVYLFYFRTFLPVIGGLIARNRAAYQYLNQSVEHFPYGQAFCDLLTASGFAAAQATPLTCGIATLYQGTKPAAERGVSPE